MELICTRCRKRVNDAGESMQCPDCFGKMEPLIVFAADGNRLREHERMLSCIWRSMPDAAHCEPVIESRNISAICNLLIDELENGSDNSDQIMQFLRAGVSEVLTQLQPDEEDFDYEQ